MASLLKVDKLDPQGGTALEIGTSGDTISIPSGATLDISASTLTPPATMPASSGINFTALNATNLGSGTVPTARLGTGTASSSTVLYGDQTYKAEPGGGKILQVVSATASVGATTTSNSFTAYDSVAPAITPATTSSRILILGNFGQIDPNNHMYVDFERAISGGATTTGITGEGNGLYYRATGAAGEEMGAAACWVDSPSTTSEITYKFCYKNNDGSTSISFGHNSTATALILLEIGA